jgi:hypothetical protein
MLLSIVESGIPQLKEALDYLVAEKEAFLKLRVLPVVISSLQQLKIVVDNLGDALKSNSPVCLARSRCILLTN